MTRHRYIVRGSHDRYEWAVVAVGEDRAIQLGGGTLAELVAAIGDDPITLLLAAEDVALCEVHIPARSRRQLETAAPYAVEELVVGPRRTANRRRGAGYGRTDRSSDRQS